jgi:hypothetical protein
VLALTGQTPALQIANIVMPSEEERAERRAIDANWMRSRAVWPTRTRTHDARPPEENGSNELISQSREGLTIRRGFSDKFGQSNSVILRDVLLVPDARND